MTMSEELVNRFKYHPAVSDAVKSKHTDIRNACALFTSVIIELTPHGREQSLAITKIEEAMMWATAAVARDPANEDQEAGPEEVDPLADLSSNQRAKLPFVMRADTPSDVILRVGHLHAKDGRCIKNNYGPLCATTGKTEVSGRPKIVKSSPEDGTHPRGFDS